jgi:hypothetical protein
MSGAIGMFGALLDASLLDIAAVTEDARRYDPDLVYGRSNIWDNNTVPLVVAATAWRREPLARTGLRWMADYGGDRRKWMIDTIPAIAGLLPPPEPVVVRRDRDGNVQPSRTWSLTGDSALSLGADYDLASSAVSRLTVQRAGDSLRASLDVEVDRRYEDPAPGVAPAELHFNLTGVSELRFDANAGSGLTLGCDPAGVTISVGSGAMRATGATVWIKDLRWHLSLAGREAAETAPPYVATPWQPHPFGRRPLLGWADVATYVLHTAILELRSSRRPYRHSDLEAAGLARRFRGAGRGIIDAASHHGRARQRAFRDLIQTWVAGDDELWEHSRIWDIIEKLNLVPPKRRLVLRRARPAGTAQMVRVAYGAGLAEADILAAVPAGDGRWRLARSTTKGVRTFRVSATAFQRTIELDNADGPLSSTDHTLIVRA